MLDQRLGGGRRRPGNLVSIVEGHTRGGSGGHKCWPGRIIEPIVYTLSIASFAAGGWSFYQAPSEGLPAIGMGFGGLALGLVAIFGGKQIRKSYKLLEERAQFGLYKGTL